MKKYSLVLLILLCLTLSVPLSYAQTKKVFAHYMVCNKSYGNGTVEGYKQDIKDAQAMGIDGFALNSGDWNKNYQQNVERIFQAASELGTDFKLFMSPDGCCGMPHTEILEMVRSYINHPNYFKYSNRPFLSGWITGTGLKTKDFWNNAMLRPLKKEGHNVYFVPFVYPSGYSSTPVYGKLIEDYSSRWKYFLDGYFYFGATGLPEYSQPSILNSAEKCAKVFHDSSRTYMAPVTPYYWGEKQKNDGRRYFEFHGGEGIAAQWKSIIEIQKPEWVELVTWNDWGEGTYFSPMDDINKYWPFAGHPKPGFYKTHKGFAELNKYYIEWYKSGQQPPIRSDNIYFFYRTHPKDAVAPDDLKGPVKKRIGEVQDEIFVTTILTAPAKLLVISGDVEKKYDVPAGIQHTRIPFNTGSQYFEISRKGKRVIYERGEDISSNITEYNFNVYSGSSSGRIYNFQKTTK
jgi:glucan endo-1,3-alpha-glucosidase